MPSFSLFVLGSGGGPLETNLSAYLCKPYNSSWKDNSLAIEAGSGVGTLVRLLDENDELFEYFGFDLSKGATAAACELVSGIHTYVITHSHLDHISGLVLSAGSFPTARRQRVAALNSVLENLESVFSGHLWPKLANRDEGEKQDTFLLTTLNQGLYQQASPHISIRTMPLSHGKSATDPTKTYESSAFFIRNDKTRREFLFMGDVEPDSLSFKPQTFAVWKAAAPLIPEYLTAIFLECSWPLGRPDDLLFGHLSPIHVIQELEALADEILALNAGNRSTSGQSRIGALKGLTLYVIHCKSILGADKEQSSVICEQVKSLACQRELGIEVVAVVQGMRIELARNLTSLIILLN